MDQPANPASARPRFGPAVTVAGGVVVTVGIFLPWVRTVVPLAGVISVFGYTRDGVLFLPLASGVIIGGLVMAKDRRSHLLYFGMLILLICLAAMLFYEFVDTLGRIDRMKAASSNAIADLGEGLYVMALGVAWSYLGFMLTLA